MIFYFCFRDRLSASDMIYIRKVIEHVYEKVLGQGSDAGSQAANSGSHEKEEEKEEEPPSASAAEERVELLCNDVVSLSGIIVYKNSSGFYVQKFVLMTGLSTISSVFICHFKICKTYKKSLGIKMIKKQKK